VRARIAAGQKAGELSDNADVDALTGMVTATLYGLAIKARDGAQRARLGRIVEQLMMMWPRREPDEADAAACMRVSSQPRRSSSARGG
jgi:hypothetical protein